MSELGVKADSALLSLLVKPVADAFKEKLGSFTSPQIESIPLILSGKNLLLMAPTGTGKTEAALLPIFSQMVLEPRGAGIRLVYITPLRALNRDLLDRMSWWCQRLDLTISVRHGDTFPLERRSQALSPPDMLISTPETLQAVIVGRVLRRHLRSVRWVVVDEVHELATDKRGSQLSVALERLEAIVDKPLQRIGLSATVGSPTRIAEFLVGAGRDCEIVRVPVAREMKVNVIFPLPSAEHQELARQLLTLPDVAARLSAIKKLVEEHESTLIFTNTRPLAEILTNRFRAWDAGFPLGIHHGSLAKSSRISAEQSLKGGSLAGIICTSSLELGIDIGKVDLCIQYNSPREVTRLVQRVGRSGHRIGRTARGVIIVMDSDDALEAAVISRRALSEELEEAVVPENSFDVLMHQMAGFIVEKSRWAVDDALLVLRKAYPFRNLTKEALLKVLRHAASLGIVYVSDDGKYSGKPFRIKQLYEYYFNNLSMIPEEKQYLVEETATGLPVGLLDEEFIAEYGEPGTRFVLMGRAWDIVQTSGQKVGVVPSEDLEGAVPSWVGDEIPVPFEVAQEVGQIRYEFEQRIRSGEAFGAIAEDIASRYEVESAAAKRAFKELLEHVKRGIPIPHINKVLLETDGEFTVLHIHGGLRINRTISRVLSYHLSRKVSSPIAAQQDPYRVVFRSSDLTPEEVVEAIRQILETSFQETLLKSVESSGLFKRRVIHAARKMGIISKEASLLDVSISKIVEAIRGTTVYDEARNYSLVQDFDGSGAERLLQRITSGKIETTIYRSRTLSPLASITVHRFEQEFEISRTDRIERLVINAVRNRLLSESPVFVCNDCWEYSERKQLREVPDELICPKCGSKNIGLLNQEPETTYGLLARKGKPINRREREIVRNIERSSELVLRHGRTAAVVLLGKNIGFKDAVQILEKESSLSTRLIELVIEAEKAALKRMFR